MRVLFVSVLAVPCAARLVHAQATTAAATIRWERPAPGTVSRGALWLRHPRAFVAVVLVLSSVIVVGALYQRFRRRR